MPPRSSDIGATKMRTQMMNEGTVSSRLHYMDALRSVLMLLGVVLHSARPYDSYAWQVKDAARLTPLDGLVTGIHLFRMPAFFVVAGYFAMYLLVRRPLAEFLQERMRRVAVPLVATLLTFNLAQVWVVMGSGGEAGFLQGALLPAWASGRWVSHLWFLVILMVYFALTALFAPLLRRLAGPRIQTSPWLRGRWALGLVLASAVLAPLAIAVAARLTKPILSDLVLGTVSPATLLAYLPCFLIGMLLCTAPQLLDRFARRNLSVVALGLCGFAGMQLTQGRAEDVYRAAHLLAESLLTWMLVRVVFSLFRDWANRPSHVFAYLSSASYSIYLFHHLTVIATATALLPLQFGAGVKFLIVLTVASLVPLAIHHFLVRRGRVMGYLFNGRLAGRRAIPTPARSTYAPQIQPSAESAASTPVHATASSQTKAEAESVTTPRPLSG